MARIVVLTSRWPWPAHSGDRVRILAICRALRQRRHELVLIACTETEEVERSEEESMFAAVHRVVIPRWRSLLNCLLALPTRKPLQLAYYESPQFAALCERFNGEADVALAHLIRTAQYVAPEAQCVRILEMTDSMSLNLERATATRTRFGRLLQLVYWIERARVRRYEMSCLARFDRASVVSEVDRRHLASASQAYAHKLVVASLAVPKRDAVRLVPGAREILFIGKVGTLPNLDACGFFISECLPKIRARHPEVMFRIVGPIEPEITRKLGDGQSGVIVTGPVPALEPYVARAFCGVAPMRKGAGIQNKILDYMSYGLPCVSTSIGYEGLRAAIGEELLVADDADAIVTAVLRLIEEPALAQRIGTRGREYANRCHSWTVSLAPLIDAIERLVALRNGGTNDTKQNTGLAQGVAAEETPLSL